MPYNNVISRNDAAALIPLEVSGEVIKSVAELNPILRLAKKLQNMATNQRRMPVMTALATAYFVNGDTGLKQSSEINWANRFIDAEEVACIVPVSEAVLDDAEFDIWGEVKPALEEAFSVAITQAILYGSNIPATWTVNLGAAGLFAGATAAGQVISAAAYADLYEALLGITPGGVLGLLALLEADGYISTGHIDHPSMRAALRNTRDLTGQPIFQRDMQNKTQFTLDGDPIYFPTDGSIVAATALQVSGQWDQLVYAMRQDITYKILDQAVIQDASGAIIYNLAQQDMVALRAVMRMGVALPNPINRMNPIAATRFPFAFMTA